MNIKNSVQRLPVMMIPLLVLMLFVTSAMAPMQTQSPPGKVTMYLFWGDGCPHCAKARPYLHALAENTPGFNLQEYEVYKNKENQALFSKLAEAFNLQQMAVPTMFIGSYTLQGYSEEMNSEIENLVDLCLHQNCADKAGPIIAGMKPGIQATPTTAAHVSLEGNSTPGRTLTLPFIGAVSLQGRSALASTVLISFVDGVNPCSIWVLSMLLALTLHTGSRRKVVIIGLVFLTVTAGIYALFILGIFSVLTFASSFGWVQAVVALFTLFFALVNIKDYFWYKQGLSFTIDDSQKPGIYQRMRKVVDASQSLPGMVAATVVLSASVSLVEFSCTAGFPVLWVNLLKAQQVTGWAFVGLLLIYMLIYQLDEMILFGTAVVTLRAGRLEEKHGRLLKLISGSLMLSLSLVMLINPTLMNDIVSSMVVFGIAMLLAAFVHWVTTSIDQKEPRLRHRHGVK